MACKRRSNTNILTTVMENPMHVMKVNAVPLFSGGAVCATNAENCGESAITARLHTNRKMMNTKNGACNMNGTSMQQMPDNSNARQATFTLPMRCDQYPPSTQLMLPAA